MRDYIRFSIDYDSGEADITPASRELLKALMEENALMAADLLQDIAGISQSLYEEAAGAMRADFERRRAEIKARRD